MDYVEEDIPTASCSKQSSSTPYQICTICGDKATGRHYGAISCDGCKGFFRRSVRCQVTYTCRFNRNCAVTKDRRNQCRYCRLRKCFKAGQRKEAVQNERGRSSLTIANELQAANALSNSVILASLIKADLLTKKDTNSVERPPSDLHCIRYKRIATTNDVYESTKTQLIVLIQWAKKIPYFCDLSVADKVALLRAQTAQFLMLGVARRSMHLSDCVLLGNDSVLTRHAEDFGPLSCSVLNHLVSPLRELNIDDTEFAILKAIIFFDPHAKGLEDHNKVGDFRRQSVLLLEDYISDKEGDSRGRFGRLLLVLPSLHTISRCLLDEIQCAKVFGLKKVDNLLEEMLLGEIGDHFANIEDNTTTLATFLSTDRDYNDCINSEQSTNF